MENDWYRNLKLDVIGLAVLFADIKVEIIFMLNTNPWILSDINLCESFFHLQEMIDANNLNLEDFIKRINFLEDNSILFNKDDLLYEFDFIKENVYLESGFITNMIDYMAIINDYTINGSEILERLEKYQDIDVLYYNQMKINNENLKQLKKERRDLF
jgi:hypothetical protein